MSPLHGKSAPEDAQRVLARELRDATHQVKPAVGVTDVAPVLLPTGITTDRVFVVGPLAEVWSDGDREDEEWLRGRLVNPTGVLFLHVDEVESPIADQLRAVDCPSMISVEATPFISVGEHGRKRVLLRPDDVTPVERRRLYRWLDETIRSTVPRIEDYRSRDTREAALAREYYGQDIRPYRDAVETARETVDKWETDGIFGAP